jgi:hypothetical protein
MVRRLCGQGSRGLLCIFPFAYRGFTSFRIISVIVPTPPLVDGRRTRISIGIVVILKAHPKNVQRKFVKSKKQRLRLSQSLCESLPFPMYYFQIFNSPSCSGFGPSKKEGSSSTPGTGTNSIPVPARVVADADVNPDAAVKAAEKTERKRRRAERREEKAARRAEKVARKDPRNSRRRDESSSRSRSRSRSRSHSLMPPVRQRRYTRSPSPKRYRSRSRDGSRGREIRFSARERSRSPPRRREFDRRSELPPPRRLSPDDRYGGSERGPERVRDRERWNLNTRR